MKKTIVPAMSLLVSSLGLAADPGYELFIQGGHTLRPSQDKSVNQAAVGGGLGLP